MEKRYKILEHPADIGLEAYGASLEEMFVNCALGLINIIAGDVIINNSESLEISISALNIENLLVKWLSEILYLFDAKKFLMSFANIDYLSDTFLRAKLSGEKYNPEKHELKLYVKAATYHKLKIEKRNGIWTCYVYFDV